MTWYRFWEFDFAVAGLSFVFILAMVAVRGVTDLLHMFKLLDHEREQNAGHQNK